MRILKASFTFLIFILIIGGVGFLIAREVLLTMAASSFTSSVTTLRRTAMNTGPYVQECRARGITDDSVSAIETIQLRFTSPREYVIEVICSQFTLDPIEVASFELPPLVTKTLGSSGLVWGQEFGGVGLEIWGRSRGIFVEDGKIIRDEAELAHQIMGPKTSCAGHGYECCYEETSLGQGEILDQVTDCPRSCYESCVRRPLVVSFRSLPLMDAGSRTIEVRAGQPVELAYVVDPVGSQELMVEIDYGDGEVEQFLTYEGSSTHFYNCAQETCQYSAMIKAVIEGEIDSHPTPLSFITVEVRR